MSWTFNEALELLGELAQTVAGNLIHYDGKHTLVGSTSETGTFSLTADGIKILEAKKAEQLRVALAAAEVKPRAKKTKAESDKVEVEPTGDLDLDVDLG